MHGDGISSIRCGRAGSKSLEIFSWHGLLGRLGTLFMKQYVVSVFKTSMCEETMTELWRIISWSMWALFKGEWPEKDHNGNPYPKTSAEGLLAKTRLAADYVCVLWNFKSDNLFSAIL